MLFPLYTEGMDIPASPHFFSPQVVRAARFYLPPEGEAPALSAAGFERCRPGYRVCREDFSFRALEIVSDGAGTLDLAGRSHPLSRGTVFTYGPGIAHGIAASPRGLGKYFLNWNGPAGGALLSEAGMPPGTVLHIASPAELEPLLSELIRNGLKNSAYSRKICFSLGELILLKIRENALPFPGRNSRAYGTFRRCRDTLEENFSRLGSLEEVARACGVDQAYLCRLFQSFAHQSPYRYLIRLKLNRAAELLHDPDTLVKQAAFAVGFSDPFHFSRLFSKAFGLSPSAYSRLYGREGSGEE